MRLHWLGRGLIALALGASSPGTAHAESEGVTTAVLGLEGIDTPAGLAEAISEQLRQKVAATHDLRLVSGKDLVELKLVFSCADEAASCIAQAGKSLDAQKLIYGSVKKVGDDFAIWLKLFDVRKEKIETWLTETLAKKETDASGIKNATTHWFARLTGHPMNVGTVQISANVYGAVVSLDGVPVGATGELPLTVSDMAAGKHDLVVEKTGHAPVKEQFTLASGQTVQFNLTLHPLPVARPAPEPAPRPAVDLAQRSADRGDNHKREVEVGGDKSGYRNGFWVTLAAGLVSAGAAVKFGLDVATINKDLDPYRRYKCPVTAANPAGICNAKGAMATPLGPADLALVASKSDEGHRDQTLQWICIGVGSALGIASGYLFYKGYLDSEEDKGRKEAHQGLRIFPTAGASSGGILAEFDF